MHEHSTTSTSFHSVHQNSLSLSLSAWLTSPIFASVELYDMKTRLQTPDKPSIFSKNDVFLRPSMLFYQTTLAGDTYLESKRSSSAHPNMKGIGVQKKTYNDNVYIYI